jgi:putative ABC transport system permease protein
MPENPQKTSPAAALRMLKWFCPPELLESIAGDLDEQYAMDLEMLGERRARQRYYWNVCRFFRPSILFRNHITLQTIPMALFKNYIIVMFRQISKHKVHTIITLSGLTIALVFAMIICSYLFVESHVNAALVDPDRIFIVENERKEDAPFMTPAPLARTLRDQYPQLIENYYRFWDRSITISKDDKHFRLQSLIGDSTLLTLTGFQVLAGDRDRALAEINSIVITEDVAKRFFNRSDVVGETLTLRTETAGEKLFKVTAVLGKLPDNSISNILNINAEIFLSTENGADFGNGGLEDWNIGQMIAYIKATPGTKPEDINTAMQALLQQHGNALLQQRMTPEAIPLMRYHLEQNNGALKKLMFMLGASALFILFMAIINFVNIMIGAAKTRMKEIGVRKSLGGLRRQIQLQFLFEAVMLSLFAGLCAICLYALSLPYLQGIVNKPLPNVFHIPLKLWMYFFLTILSTGIVAGIYPSMHLSASKTIESLKGKIRSARTSLSLSKSLVGLQFMLAISAFIF